MRIRLRRIGGIAATIRRGETSLDTDDLSPEQRDEIHSLVDAARFFELPDDLGSGDAAPDRTAYVLEIDDADRHGAVSFDLPDASPELTRLVERVRQLGRRAP